MRCLNCGAEGAEAYCPQCGQRHVPRESYDVRGLVVDYGYEVVSSLRILRTLWKLVRHPGLATVEYMDGQRKPQVNPLWLYLFFWSTLITAGQLVMSAEPADLGSLSNPEIHAVLVKIAPWFLAVMAYTQPLASLLGTALGIRALATKEWLEAWVYALHIETVGLIVSTPAAMTMAWVGLWGQSSWVGYVVSIGIAVPLWVYSFLAFRGAFAARHERPGLRWLGSVGIALVITTLWSSLLAIGLWVAIFATAALTATS